MSGRFPHDLNPAKKERDMNADTCWSCGSHKMSPAGTDDNGIPATVCDNCGERQEDV